MNPVLNEICGRYFENLTCLKSVFAWEPSAIYPVAAAQLTGHGFSADADRLGEARRILKEEEGLFSSFRGNGALPVICSLAASADPRARMEASKTMYRLLKEEFSGSTYLAMSAVLLPDLVSEDKAAPYIERGRRLYRMMKKEHPILTGSEDSVLAVLLSFSEKSDETVLREMEEAYDFLKEQLRWSGSNSVQTVSHILVLGDRSASQSAQRLVSLFESLQNAGHKYGKDYQLAALATLVISDRDLSSLSRDILDCEAFLSDKKWYKGVLGFSAKDRLMHAAVLTSLQDEGSAVNDAGVLSSTLAMIAAQQAAMCAIIASSASVSAASHG